MSSESPEHKTVVEALALRLRQLYPAATVTCGTKHRASGRKPDIWIGHPDGREWAYEIVYGNRGIAHLRETHLRYAQAGVQDHWILWQGLQPGGQASAAAPTEQIRWVDAFSSVEQATLNDLHRVILEAQGAEVGWIYSFMLDVGETDEPLGAFVRLHLLGLELDRIEGWRGPAAVRLERHYGALPTLTFDTDGRPLAPSPDELDAAQHLADAMGLPVGDLTSPADVLRAANALVSTSEGVTALALRAILSAMETANLSEADQLEVISFLNAPGSPELKTLLGPVEPSESADPYAEAGSLEQALERATTLQAWLQSPAVPDSVRRVLIPLFSDLRPAQEFATLLHWQQESKALNAARRGELDQGRDRR